MLCQECKLREATVHFTKIINNYKTELHLCEECAGKQENLMQIPSFSINDLLQGFMDVGLPTCICCAALSDAKTAYGFRKV